LSSFSLIEGKQKTDLNHDLKLISPVHDFKLYCESYNEINFGRCEPVCFFYIVSKDVKILYDITSLNFQLAMYGYESGSN